MMNFPVMFWGGGIDPHDWTLRGPFIPNVNTFTDSVAAISLGRVVAVAKQTVSENTSARALYTDDGVTFTAAVTPSNDWEGVAWSPTLGLFAAVASSGTGNRVMTSPDGITWTARTSAADNSWQAVEWCPTAGLFIAVGSSGTGNRVMTSPDGIAWTTRTSAANYAWMAVADSGGIIVAVANSGGATDRVMTSVDGLTWTLRTSVVSSATWVDVTWQGSRFVAVNSLTTSNYRVMTSSDGITWTQQFTTSSLVRGYAVECYGTTCVIFCGSVTASISTVARSIDGGLTWALVSPIPLQYTNADTLTTGCYASWLSKFIGFNSDGYGARVIQSTAGDSWEAAQWITYNPSGGVAYATGLGKFAVGASDSTGWVRAMLTADLTSWAESVEQRPQYASGTRFLFWSDTFSKLYGAVQVNSGARIVCYTGDGVNWTDISSMAGSTPIATDVITGFAEGPSRLIAVEDYTGSTTGVSYTDDGINWTRYLLTAPKTLDWRDVVWAPALGLFVAVASSGTGNRVMTSPNAVNDAAWTSRTSAADNSWYGVTWSPSLGLLVAVARNGVNNRVMTSPDGITWTTRTTGSQVWNKVVWAESLGLFVAIGETDGSAVMHSPDGITWTTVATPAGFTGTHIGWSAALGVLMAAGPKVTAGANGWCKNVMTSTTGN